MRSKNTQEKKMTQWAGLVRDNAKVDNVSIDCIQLSLVFSSHFLYSNQLRTTLMGMWAIVVRANPL